MVDLQAIQPGELITTLDQRRRGFCKCLKVDCVSASGFLSLATILKTLHPKLADRLEHDKAGFPITSFCLPQQAVLDQLLQPTENVDLAVRVGNRLGGFQRQSACEDSEPSKHVLLT